MKSPQGKFPQRMLRLLLATLAVLGLASFLLFRSKAGEGVADSKAPAPPKRDATTPEASRLPTVDQKNSPAWGRFVSFRDGSLTLLGNTATMVWRELSPDIGVSQWSEPAQPITVYGEGDFNFTMILLGPPAPKE